MLTLKLDAAVLRKPDEFYATLLPLLRAPAGQGHNLDALDDSIFSGAVNGIEPSFRIVVCHAWQAIEPITALLRQFEALITKGRAETGRKVFLELM